MKINNKDYSPAQSDMRKEADEIQSDVRRNEPNQATNNDGTVDESALMEMDYGYADDHEDDFDIG